MINTFLKLLAKHLMGRGIDKKFPFLVTAYKKVSVFMAEEGETEVTLQDGSTLFVSNKDAGLGLMLRTQGVFEPIQTKLMLSQVSKNQTIFDIGANIGYYTVQFAKKVGAKGKVYAFEPDDRNYALLVKNIKANKLTNVVPVKTALGEKNGFVYFAPDAANPGESAVSTTKQGKKVRMYTLDSFVAKHKVKALSLIKMDVEGAEMRVFEGASKLASRKNIHLFFEVNPSALAEFDAQAHDLLDSVEKLGFKPYSIIDERGKRTIRYSTKGYDKLMHDNAFVNICAKN